MFKIGDKVVVTRSPFDSIRPGTMANIIDVKHLNFGRRWTLYTLDTKPCHSFREWELKKVDEKE